MRDVAQAEALRATKLRHGPPFPSAFGHYQIALPPHPGVDAQAVAVDLELSPDPDLLRLTALRHWWSADHGQVHVRLAARNEITDGPVLTATDLGLIDPALVTHPGCPVRPPLPTTRHSWVRATRMDGVSGWVPYTLAFPRAWDTRPDEPPAHPPFLTGLGAGTSRAAAFDDAWAGIAVEDALWRWWSRADARMIRSTVPIPAEIRDSLADSSISFRLHHLPTRLGGAVTLAAVDDGQVTALGGGYGPDSSGERTAIARALWQLVLARSLADPDSPMYAAGTPGLPPHRADRAYLAAAGGHHRGLIDPIAHVQLLLDPVVQAEISAKLNSSREETGTDESLNRADAWVIELTPPASPAGVCVRVLVPGAATIPLGAFPPDTAVTGAPTTRFPYPGW